MSAPLYNYLGHPCEPDQWTPDQRAIMTATEMEIGVEIAFGSAIPGVMEDELAYLQTRGWWAEVKTPFTAGGLYWAGLTPLGVSGWNGRPDHQVGDVSPRLALWRAMLLAFLTGPHPGAEDEAASQEPML